MIVTTSGRLPFVLLPFTILLNQLPFAVPLPYNVLVCRILTLAQQTKHKYQLPAIGMLYLLLYLFSVTALTVYPRAASNC
jgi:hypothetical protein